VTLYTFGLRYPDGTVEEIDVEAASYRDARAQAEVMSRTDYLPGGVIEVLPPGGSSGIIQVFSI
jgi:hypothetical protein